MCAVFVVGAEVFVPPLHDLVWGNGYAGEDVHVPIGNALGVDLGLEFVNESHWGVCVELVIVGYELVSFFRQWL